MVKNILSVVGGLVVAGIVIGLIAFGGMIPKVQKLDPNAIGSYMDMADVVLETGDAGLAMTKLVKVDESQFDGESEEEKLETIRENLKEYGERNNMLIVSDTIMFKDGDKDFRGNDTRHVEIIAFCNKQIARDFIDYSKSFGTFMPCRAMIIRDEDGSLWINTMKLDLMIAGGHSLSAPMLKMALHIKHTMYGMLDYAATGNDPDEED